MTSRPFHHGNLRAALLDQAEVVLREGGLADLSLRDLARQVGVSHGAPRNHFADKQALIEALAVRGFARLAEQVRTAVDGDDPLVERFRRVGRAYVDFAVDDAALMELMFTAKADAPASEVHEAAEHLFGVLDASMGPAAGSAHPGSRERLKLLFAATMQGTAALITARRVTRDQGDVLVDDAVEVLLDSRLGARTLGRPSSPPRACP